MSTPLASKSEKELVLFLVGPTAVGKSEVAVELAKEINAEIISCDSMQIYKGIDILSSKPSKELRKKIKHHLIDIVKPAQEFNVYRYYRLAEGKIKEILKRKKIPLFVGGSALYMNILLEGIFRLNKSYKGIREKLYQEAEAKGVDFLYDRLRMVDPQASARIHPHDLRRIVRALEVYELTRKPISELQKQREGISSAYRIRIFALDMPKQEIYQRISLRLENMFKEGIVEEVAKLLKLKLSKTILSAIGIKEIKGYLDGDYDLEKAKLLMEKRTRLLVKKQLAWFKKDKRIEWVKVNSNDNPKSIAQKIIFLLNKNYGESSISKHKVRRRG